MGMFCVILFLSASLFGTTKSAKDPWSYEQQESWPGVCRTGSQQSPIDISTREAVVDTCGEVLKGPLVYEGLDGVNVTAENNGHTLMWSLAPGSRAPTLSGGPLRQEYSFLQFHLHWLSEHAIDGVKQPLEIHIVHKRSDLTVEEALLQPDGLVVIGVFCQVHGKSPKSLRALEQIMGVVPELGTKTVNSTRPTIIDLSRLQSPHLQSYYTYQGSLTTPECQEAVVWIVMDQPIIIADTQYKKIRKVDVGGVSNFRSLQPRNRKVYRSVSSCSTMLAPGAVGLGTAGLLSAAFNCMASKVYNVGKKGYCAVNNLKRKVFGDNAAVS